LHQFLLLSFEHLLEAVQMALRRWSVVVLAATILASMGAQYRTQNFIVNAPSNEIAQQVGQWAEHYRKAKAIEWLGQEMPNWQKPCPVFVTVSMEGPSGATSFVFHPQGGVLEMKMEIQGPLDRLLSSVLPHEITHTVFAHYFRRAVPRWADEGGSVLSEDDLERDKHDKIVRSILNRTQQYHLRQLFGMTDYPKTGDKVMCLYAEGFSVSHYLVYVSDRQTFLRFVNIGMQGNWDQAVQSCYGLSSVDELEGAWLKHLKDTRGISITQLNKNKETGQPFASAAPGKGNTLVRLTVPPADPLLPVPIYRGAMPVSDTQAQKSGTSQLMPRPGYLPEYVPANNPPQQSWQTPAPQTGNAPLQQQQYAPIPIQLGTPQFQPPASTMPRPVSPVGYPGG
jgi:hypothetical protein